MPLPLWISKPVRAGWASIDREFLNNEYAPGTTRFTLEPESDDTPWLLYEWTYGQMKFASGSQDGVQHYDSDFKFQWRHAQLDTFTVPMIPSSFDEPMPLHLEVSSGNPLIQEAQNDTGETQRIDARFLVLEFTSQDTFDLWTDWMSTFTTRPRVRVVRVEQEPPESQPQVPSVREREVPGIGPDD